MLNVRVQTLHHQIQLYISLIVNTPQGIFGLLCAWLFSGAHLANHTDAIYQMCAQFNHCKITYQHPNLFNHWLQFHILNTERTWFPKQSAPYAGTWTWSRAEQIKAKPSRCVHECIWYATQLHHHPLGYILSLEQPPHTCTYQSQHTILTPHMTFVCSILVFFSYPNYRCKTDTILSSYCCAVTQKETAITLCTIGV